MFEQWCKPITNLDSIYYRSTGKGEPTESAQHSWAMPGPKQHDLGIRDRLTMQALPFCMNCYNILSYLVQKLGKNDFDLMFCSIMMRIHSNEPQSKSETHWLKYCWGYALWAIEGFSISYVFWHLAPCPIPWVKHFPPLSPAGRRALSENPLPQTPLISYHHCPWKVDMPGYT